LVAAWSSIAQSQGVLDPPVEYDRHAVRSEELRVIMRRMEALVYDRIQSELALDKERLRQADELAATAGELATTASSIFGASAYQMLDDAARQRFDAFAAELQREATELQRLAREGGIVASSAQFERMSHACAGCHSLYRAR
jgi:cytochrome c556